MKLLPLFFSFIIVFVSKQPCAAQATLNNTGNIYLGTNTVLQLPGDLHHQQGNLNLESGSTVLIQGKFKVDTPATVLWNVDQILNGQQFQVTDSTLFNGTVQVNFTNNFSPLSTDSIRLLSCTTISGNIQDTIYPSGYNGYFLFSNGYLNLTNLNTIPTYGALQVNAFLQGYYQGNEMMAPVLSNSGLNNNPQECDSVMVCLRDTLAPYNLIWSEKTVLQTNGTLAVAIPTPYLNQWYYLVLKHRSHLETWSFQPIYFSAQTAFDFTGSATQAFGQNMTNLGDGNWALYAGDINQDEAIDALDYVMMDPEIVAGNSGYIASDLNGDGSVDALDYLLLDPNVIEGIGSIHP